MNSISGYGYTGLSRNTQTYGRNSSSNGSGINSHLNESWWNESDDSKSGNTNSAESMGFKNYRHLLSANPLPMGEEVFKSKVIEQARKDAARGVFKGNEFKTLEKTYVQAVSPDRIGIIKNLMSASQLNPPPKGIPNAVTNVNFAGGAAATFSHQSGWQAITTQMEKARAAEIRNIYTQAWEQANRNNGGSNNGVNSSGGALDITA